MLYKLQRKSHYVLVHEKTNSIFVSTEYRFHNYLKLVLKLISNFSTLSFTRETRRQCLIVSLIARHRDETHENSYVSGKVIVALLIARDRARDKGEEQCDVGRNQTTKIRADKSVSRVFKLHRRTLEIHDETITGRR